MEKQRDGEREVEGERERERKIEGSRVRRMNEVERKELHMYFSQQNKQLQLSTVSSEEQKCFLPPCSPQLWPRSLRATALTEPCSPQYCNGHLLQLNLKHPWLLNITSFFIVLLHVSWLTLFPPGVIFPPFDLLIFLCFHSYVFVRVVLSVPSVCLGLPQCLSLSMGFSYTLTDPPYHTPLPPPHAPSALTRITFSAFFVCCALKPICHLPETSQTFHSDKNRKKKMELVLAHVFEILTFFFFFFFFTFFCLNCQVSHVRGSVVMEG